MLNNSAPGKRRIGAMIELVKILVKEKIQEQGKNKQK